MLIVQVAAQLKTCGKHIALTERILYDLNARTRTRTHTTHAHNTHAHNTHTHYP